jgi:hypothetical protein
VEGDSRRVWVWAIIGWDGGHGYETIVKKDITQKIETVYFGKTAFMRHH